MFVTGGSPQLEVRSERHVPCIRRRLLRADAPRRERSREQRTPADQDFAYRRRSRLRPAQRRTDNRASLAVVLDHFEARGQPSRPVLSRLSAGVRAGCAVWNWVREVALSSVTSRMSNSLAWLDLALLLRVGIVNFGKAMGYNDTPEVKFLAYTESAFQKRAEVLLKLKELRCRRARAYWCPKCSLSSGCECAEVRF